MVASTCSPCSESADGHEFHVRADDVKLIAVGASGKQFVVTTPNPAPCDFGYCAARFPALNSGVCGTFTLLLHVNLICRLRQ